MGDNTGGTLLDLLEQKVASNADRPLYSFLDRHLKVSSLLSYQALYDRAEIFAATLQSQACQGKPVLVYCPHGPDFLIGFFACILAGAWPIPVTRHRAHSTTGFASLIQNSGATTLITTTKREAGLSLPTGAELRVLSVDNTSGGDARYRRPMVRDSDIAFIQYTSGSTSSPKGVVISHANVMHNADQIHNTFNCTTDDVGVSWLPFHHDMGLIGHVIQPLFAGIQNYFLSPVDFMARPARWLQAISGLGGTLSGGPDFAFLLATEKVTDQEMADLDLAHWRLAYCGAEKINPETLMRFARRFGRSGFRQTSLFPCYGLAESTLFVSGQHGIEQHSLSGAMHQKSTVCVGQPATGTSVIIVDPVDGSRSDEGGVGEVCLHSSSVAKRYFNDRVTSEAVFNSVIDDGKRYCRTGDAGYLHDQRLFLLGRYKNVFKRRGCTYHAEDIEAIIKYELGVQQVARCAAFAIIDDASESLVVLLERADRRARTGDMSEAELIGKAGALVVDEFGIIADDIRLLPANTLPLTSSGKIRRDACVGLYRRQYMPDIKSAPDTGLQIPAYRAHTKPEVNHYG